MTALKGGVTHHRLTAGEYSVDALLDNRPTMKWYLTVLEPALEVVKNTLLNYVDDDDDDKDELKSIESNLEDIKKSHATRDETAPDSWLADKLKDAKKILTTDIGSLDKALARLKAIVDKKAIQSEAALEEGLAPFKGLFESIELNPISEDFQKDSNFAYFRVGGPNPMLIECIIEIPSHFAVTEAGFKSVMGDSESLNTALQENRVFLIDYKALQSVVDDPGEWDGLPKQLFAPMALFAKHADNDALIPVAVQRTQNASDSDVVYATKDKNSAGYWPWQTAKSIIEMAEGNYHELFVHLARTHLLIEAFALSTNRNLAENHPINVLLLPHFEGTFFINNSAATTLIAEDSPIDYIFAGKIEASQAAAGNDRLNYDFYENMLPKNLENRRVKDPAILPNYPYRDDATLIWNTLREWVSEYINIYYGTDADVTADTELEMWTTDLINTGKVAGFKPITGREQLKDVLTMVIFTGSAQHAAVNFPQRIYMSYAPAISGALWGPKDPAGTSEQDWLQTLPPLKLANQQLNVLHLLGGVYYSQLGYYKTNDFPYCEWFEDDRIIGKGNALERFQTALQGVEDEINLRNKDRDISYSVFLPSKIPMSINI
ncbi:hypothetical protein N9V90_02935 [Endozoicomonas sp.]|nr:hypothetical protein [Endozoicomonas sp.]